MGFASYEKYLSSRLWRDIRNRVLLSANGECFCCKKPPNQIHHCDYTEFALNGTDLSVLWAICRKCHFWAEFHTTENKYPLDVATRRLWRKYRQKCTVNKLSPIPFPAVSWAKPTDPRKIKQKPKPKKMSAERQRRLDRAMKNYLEH